MGYNTALRDSTLVWFIRTAQCIVTFTVIAIGIANVNDWHEIGCSAPEQLQVNVAAAIASLPVILYLIMSTGKGRVAQLPWSAATQLVLDATLALVWAIPSSLPSYECATVCKNCNTWVEGLQNLGSSKSATGFYIWVGKLTCSCYRSNSDGNGYFRRVAVTIRRSAYLRPGKGDPATKVFRGVTRIAAKRSSNGIMIALLIVSMALTAMTIHRKRTSLRRSSSTPEFRDFGEEKKSDVTVTAMPLVLSIPGSPRSSGSGASSPRPIQSV